MSAAPILYSFRRCPYAMRARMALWIAGITVELREVKLANKPPEMIEASPKGTVPVLVLPDGTVEDESEGIMLWALRQNDPEDWLAGYDTQLVVEADGPFKHHLDRYKYPTRYPDEANGDAEGFREHHRARGLVLLSGYDAMLKGGWNLERESRSFSDIFLFPFVRQFANTDRAWFDAQDLPHLHPWLEAHLASDLFANIMPKFTPWLSGDTPVIFGSQA